MAGIIYIKKIDGLVSRLKRQKKAIVLVGGCFDVLHPGHVVFLEKAKKAGNILIVLLESDEKVKILKGINRPVHNQRERAEVLSALKAVDYVVMLPFLEENNQYDELIMRIKPDVIAISSKDKKSPHHQRTAKLAGAKLKVVTKEVGNYSTTKLLNHY